MDFLSGEILAIDKPYEWTSFGIVARVRWLLSQRLGTKVKVGPFPVPPVVPPGE